MKKTFILFVIFFSFLSFSQSREIGLDVGYWNWREYEAHFSRIGIKYFYTPKEAFFKFKTGLTLDSFAGKYSRFGFIRIPIGLDVTFGKKIQPNIGFSILNSFWLNPNESQHNAIKKYIFQLVANPCAGVGYQISTKYHLGLTYQYNFDIIPLYLYKTAGKSGHQNTEGEYYSYGFLNLCFRYKM
jgi:hypothetical protein